MTNKINASSTSGLITSGSNSNILELQADGVTGLSVNADSSININNNLTVNGVNFTDAANSTTVVSLAALKALTTRPLTVIMQYRTTLNDQGGGIFRWESGSSTTPDDVFVIQPTSGPSGRYKRIYNGEINVRWFGAIGNGSNDDTVGLQTAVNYAANLATIGTLYFPSGQYVITSPITVPLNKSVFFRGEGSNNTIIRQTNSTANGLVLNRNNYRTGGGISGMAIEAGNGLQSNDWFGPGSSGVGVLADGMADTWGLRDVSINGFAIGLSLLGCWNTRHYNLRIMYYANTALLIDKSTTTGVAGGNFFDGVKISNFGYTGTVAGTIGIRIRASGGEFFQTIDVTGSGKGWIFDPRIGDQVVYIEGWNVIADSSSDDVWTFDGTLGGVRACYFNSFWAGYNEGHGVVVKGPNTSNIFFEGRARENKKHGILIQGPGVYWQGGSINNNSRGNSNIYNGMHVDANISNWGVRNTLLGNDASSANSDQRNGLEIVNGTTDDYVIMGNKFTGNLNGAFVNGASGTNKIIESNYPSTNESINRTNGIFPDPLRAGRNASLAHALYQGNDSALTIYSDSANEVVFDTNQVSNPNTKYNLHLAKYGGDVIAGNRLYTHAGEVPVVVDTLVALKALTLRPAEVFMKGRVVANPDGGGGTFIWVPGDQSIKVTNDPFNGVWVPPNTDVTGTSGAWQRQWQGEVSPHWFDNIPDETFDTYQAGQRAINWIAANYPVGAVLKFGPRAYWKSGEWLITSNRVTLRGSGISTQIVEMTAGGNGIHFQNCDRPVLERMYIWSNLTKTGGTSGVWFDNCHDAYLKDFRIEKHHHGVRCTADWQQYLLYITSGDIGHCDGDGIRLADIGTLVQGIFIVNLHITACAGAGISQFNVSGFQSVNVDILQCGQSFTTYPYGVVKTGNTHSNTIIDGIASTADLNEFGVIEIGTYRGAVTNIISANSIEVWPPLSSTGTGVSFYFFNQVVAGEHIGLVCDTAINSGMVLFTNGGIIADQKFYYARCGACGPTNPFARGIHIASNGSTTRSEIRDIQFTSLWAEQNGAEGVRVEQLSGTSVHHISFNQSSIGDNSLATNNTYDGIYIGAGVSHFQIIGGHSSNSPLIAHTNQQRYGLCIETGASDYFSVISLDLTGNVTGPIFDGSSGTHKTIIGNAGTTTQRMFGGLTIKDISTNDNSIIIDGSSNTNGGAAIKLMGDGVTTPNKWIRSHLGEFQVTNSNFTAVIMGLTDDGDLNAPIHSVKDGVTAPVATAGRAKIYVDNADGDLKIIFGDGTIKTIVTDT